MAYAFMLAILPIVVVIFLWGDTAPEIDVAVKTLLSAVLLTLAAAGFLDLGSEKNETE